MWDMFNRLDANVCEIRTPASFVHNSCLSSYNCENACLWADKVP